MSIEQDGKTYTKISRITGEYDLNKIALVNNLSRRFLRGMGHIRY